MTRLCERAWRVHRTDMTDDEIRERMSGQNLSAALLSNIVRGDQTSRREAGHEGFLLTIADELGCSRRPPPRTGLVRQVIAAGTTTRSDLMKLAKSRIVGRAHRAINRLPRDRFEEPRRAALKTHLARRAKQRSKRDVACAKRYGVLEPGLCWRARVHVAETKAPPGDNLLQRHTLASLFHESRSHATKRNPGSGCAEFRQAPTEMHAVPVPATVHCRKPSDYGRSRCGARATCGDEQCRGRGSIYSEAMNFQSLPEHTGDRHDVKEGEIHHA